MVSVNRLYLNKFPNIPQTYIMGREDGLKLQRSFCTYYNIPYLRDTGGLLCGAELCRKEGVTDEIRLADIAVEEFPYKDIQKAPVKFIKLLSAHQIHSRGKVLQRKMYIHGRYILKQSIYFVKIRAVEW